MDKQPILISFFYSHSNQERIEREKQESEERNCAIVLFCIVAIFLICNIPRITLNMNESFYIERIDDVCYQKPLWVDIFFSINPLLLQLNSSINFFIYCLANPGFRMELTKFKTKCGIFSFFNKFHLINLLNFRRVRIMHSYRKVHAEVNFFFTIM